MIKPGSTILFQGDSITDAGRDKFEPGPNRSGALGWGYCNQIASQLLRDRPGDGLRFYNRGINGNCIDDLHARWRLDAVNLRPDLISILVGVNDAWQAFMRDGGAEMDRFEAVYRMLLADTKEQLPGVQLVLCEPFALMSGLVSEAWVQGLWQRQRIVSALAGEFGACFVPFQAAMDDAVASAPPEHWTLDGVHPTPAGHSVLARCWLETVVRGG
jgi:lysophospholipase L1-like esterase